MMRAGLNPYYAITESRWEQVFVAQVVTLYLSDKAFSQRNANLKFVDALMAIKYRLGSNWDRHDAKPPQVPEQYQG
jgi:hypothetical protein